MTFLLRWLWEVQAKSISDNSGLTVPAQYKKTQHTQTQKLTYKMQQNSSSCGSEQSNIHKSCTKINNKNRFSTTFVPMLQFEAVINQPKLKFLLEFPRSSHPGAAQKCHNTSKVNKRKLCWGQDPPRKFHLCVLRIRGAHGSHTAEAAAAAGVWGMSLQRQFWLVPGWMHCPTFKVMKNAAFRHW